MERRTALTRSRPTEKREAVLRAALELFSQRGLHGTAVPLVAERAGVGIGTIYRYFETKEDLVNAVYRQQKAALLEALRKGFPADAPAREQFHALWNRLVDFARENPESVRFMDLHYHQPYLDQQSRDLEKTFVDWAVGLFDGAVRLQILKDAPPELLVSLVKGALVGMLRAAWDGRIELSPPVVQKAEECCWEAIRR